MPVIAFSNWPTKEIGRLVPEARKHVTSKPQPVERNTGEGVPTPSETNGQPLTTKSVNLVEPAASNTATTLGLRNPYLSIASAARSTDTSIATRNAIPNSLLKGFLPKRDYYASSSTSLSSEGRIGKAFGYSLAVIGVSLILLIIGLWRCCKSDRRKRSKKNQSRGAPNITRGSKPCRSGTSSFRVLRTTCNLGLSSVLPNGRSPYCRPAGPFTCEVREVHRTVDPAVQYPQPFNRGRSVRELHTIAEVAEYSPTHIGSVATSFPSSFSESERAALRPPSPVFLGHGRRRNPGAADGELQDEIDPPPPYETSPIYSEMDSNPTNIYNA